jgi:hypothetical protein
LALPDSRVHCLDDLARGHHPLGGVDGQAVCTSGVQAVLLRAEHRLATNMGEADVEGFLRALAAEIV